MHSVVESRLHGVHVAVPFRILLAWIVWADEQSCMHSMHDSRPASLILVKDQLNEFSHAVVERAVQIRHLVTNKLLLESANPDPKIRIRALELLGKISDVGLFTERSEVTITHQSTDELKAALREKFNKLRKKLDIVDVEEAQPVQTINLDKELGLPAPENTPETPKSDDFSSKNDENGGENISSGGVN